MTIQSYKLGPGTLKLGAAGVMDVSCQVTAAKVEAAENVDSPDAVPVLCGEELQDEDDVTLEWTLTFTLVQDIAAAGAIAWSWTNGSTEQAFEFIPNTVGARKVTGTARVIPLAIGGEVKSRPQSDATWKVIGTPVLANVA
jgi:hypothetical protein